MEREYSHNQVLAMMELYGNLRYAEGVRDTLLNPSENAGVIEEKSKLVTKALAEVNRFIPFVVKREIDLPVERTEVNLSLIDRHMTP
jgi:hypothetical protein